MTKKILFFTAGPVATGAETAQIAALNAMTIQGYTVGVRNALESGSYGAGIESCDLVCGTVPTAFNGVTNYGEPNAARPCAFQLNPATKQIAALETTQLQALKADGLDVSALTLTDVTAVNTTYASSQTSKATVSAGGVVSGVAAGTSQITATHTYTAGKTITATMIATVA